MQRWVICLLINFFVCTAAFSQDSLQSITTSQNDNTRSVSRPAVSTITNIPVPTAAHLTATPIKTLPNDYYFNSVGFFCKKELQIEKATKLPLKFRLGSVNYTDKLEGKGQGFLQPAKKY